MGLPEEIKRTRQHSFLTQQEFIKKIGVAFSTVNRWESGCAKPNLKAMKKINAFYFVDRNCHICSPNK